MNTETQKMIAEMVAAARAGQKILPAFWQPIRGRSNTVSAAIAAAKKAGLLVEGGKDGCGKPYYVAAVPAATHAAPASVN